VLCGRERDRPAVTGKRERRLFEVVEERRDRFADRLDEVRVAQDDLPRVAGPLVVGVQRIEPAGGSGNGTVA
jgi:hypothetical protein